MERQDAQRRLERFGSASGGGYRCIPNGYGRREFLIGAGALIGSSALLGVGCTIRPSDRVMVRPKFSAYPFSLGVASGEPLPNSIVLWTRLAPNPLNGGGMPAVNVPVQWQIAGNPKMGEVLANGEAIATPEFGHSVHVSVDGLRPGRWYWYQFKAGHEVSEVGRTRTAPSSIASIGSLNFAIASCQNWEDGYYVAYKHMAEEELHFVVHLGDYIYEGGVSENKPRRHNGPEVISLDDYRNRYALYKSDPNLRAAHSAFPWIVTLDDHDVDNDWADGIPEDPDNQTLEEFLVRRANAFQAYYEHMPLRLLSKPRGADIQMYRRFSFGDLARFHVLDTRQFRNDQAGGFIKPRSSKVDEPNRTMTGKRQERWLFEGLTRSEVRWNVVAQQTIMAEFDYQIGPGRVINHDQWDGYTAARQRILNFIKNRRPPNPVVLSGDWHSFWVNDLKDNLGGSISEILATEFVGSSITSNCWWSPKVKAALPENPHVKFFDGESHGYVRCRLGRDVWRSDYRSVSSILNPNSSTIRTLASFVVEDGRPGAQQD